MSVMRFISASSVLVLFDVEVGEGEMSVGSEAVEVGKDIETLLVGLSKSQVLRHIRRLRDP